jgi:protein-S-isoprenylcysteine O-methyltransferase Ste14
MLQVNMLLVRAVLGLAFLLALIGGLLFGVSGTLAYWQGWAFLGVFGCAVVAITVDLAVRDPALLERRVHAGPLAEQDRTQRVIQSLASLAFLAVFAASAFDHREGWSRVPDVVALVGDGLVVAGLWIVFRVFRANTFTAATIEVKPEQQLITTGPYAVVRHPMYAGAFAMLIGVPIALGSWWGLVPVAGLMAVIVWRLIAEERYLRANLTGYDEYCAKVRHRLVPYVW